MQGYIISIVIGIRQSLRSLQRKCLEQKSFAALRTAQFKPACLPVSRAVLTETATTFCGGHSMGAAAAAPEFGYDFVQQAPPIRIGRVRGDRAPSDFGFPLHRILFQFAERQNFSPLYSVHAIRRLRSEIE